jgi:hypothetical protein
MATGCRPPSRSPPAYRRRQKLDARLLQSQQEVRVTAWAVELRNHQRGAINLAGLQRLVERRPVWSCLPLSTSTYSSTSCQLPQLTIAVTATDRRPGPAGEQQGGRHSWVATGQLRGQHHGRHPPLPLSTQARKPLAALASSPTCPAS